ncbi:MAG: SpoIIE family protein phosphatase [Oscillospiraceae bacterium]|nr:SpoIIE family protein phosphatase [Oscillospiraceae bacterium]
MKVMSKSKKKLSIYPGIGKVLCQCLLSLMGGWILGMAKIRGQALPLGACFVAAQSVHLRMWSGLVGSVVGYVLTCDAVDAMEFSALALLMPVTRILFQSTDLTEKKWFMPLCCGGIAAVFGAVRPGVAGSLGSGLLLTRVLPAVCGTYLCRRTFCGDRRARVFFAGFLILGLCGRGTYIDMGLLLAVVLGVLSHEIVPSAVMGMAADLSGSGEGCHFTMALLLPGILCNFLRVRSTALRSLMYMLFSGVVLLFFGQGQMGQLLGILGGGILAYGIGKREILSPEITASEDPSDKGILEEAATVLELLSVQLPKEQSLCPTETDEVFDGAAEKVCRKCAFFHRCWQTYGESTYAELSRAAEEIMKGGFARADHFSRIFRKRCCNLDAFVGAVNSELDGMLYRRQYRFRLKESHKVLSGEFHIVAKYLRTMSREVPREPERRYRPLVSICSASKEGGQQCGDRGACFAGRGANYFVLLCDGMGTGAEAAQISNYTVRLLQRLLCSGLPAEEAMKLLNGNLFLQGSGIFSTVDLLELDLYSGRAILYKWGSAPSYRSDGEEVEKIGTATPPPGVGVGEDHLPQKYVLSLQGGEMLVLISDGAYGEETETAIASYRNASPQELAALLIGGMQADDDMTAIVISLRLRTS